MRTFEYWAMNGVKLLGTGALFWACSSGSGSAAPGEGDPATFCNALCAWKTRCEPGGDCAGACAASTYSLRSKVRSSYWNGVALCVDVQACDGNVDATCVTDYKNGDPAYPNIKEVAACEAKRTECGAIFTKHYCKSLAALLDAARAEADTCRNKACEEVEACLVTSGAFKLN